MHRIVFTIAALLSLSLGGCTVHHGASASASFHASGEARSSGSGETVGSAPPKGDRNPPRVVRERRERPPARLAVRRRRPAPNDRRPPRKAPAEPEEEAQPEDEPVFGSPVESDGSFEGNVYFIPEDSPKIPDLDALDPVGTVYTKKLDIAPRSFEEGFPGISDRFEWFAIRYTARVSLDEAGEYAFRIHSDDGAKLYVNGQLVVDNDGQHAPNSAEGTIELEAGAHDFVIEYFQGPRYEIALQLFVTLPGDDEEAIFSLE